MSTKWKYLGRYNRVNHKVNQCPCTHATNQVPHVFFQLLVWYYLYSFPRDLGPEPGEADSLQQPHVTAHLHSGHTKSFHSTVSLSNIKINN
jgi:hypothetical protein